MGLTFGDECMIILNILNLNILKCARDRDQALDAF